MKKILLIFGVILLLLFLFTKEHGNKNALVVNSDAVILAFGDSLTQGYGAAAEDSYPSALSRLLGVKVINGGVSGETSREALLRLPKVLAEYKPSAVILCHGGNDILRKYDLTATKQNISQMIKLISQSGAKIILIGAPQLSGFRIGTASFYDELADEYDLPYNGEIIKKIIKNPSLKSDQIHPNKEGYKLLALSVYELFKKQD